LSAWFGDAHALEVLHRDGAGLVLVLVAHQPRRQHQVLDDGEMREEIEVLEHHADLAAHRVDVAAVLGQLMAVDDDAAAIMLLEPVDAADHGRLAGSGGPADNDALAALDAQIDVAQHMKVAIPLVDADELNRHLPGFVLFNLLSGCLSHQIPLLLWPVASRRSMNSE
jgi:hypothetical protein